MIKYEPEIELDSLSEFTREKVEEWYYKNYEKIRNYMKKFVNKTTYDLADFEHTAYIVLLETFEKVSKEREETPENYETPSLIGNHFIGYFWLNLKRHFNEMVTNYIVQDSEVKQVYSLPDDYENIGHIDIYRIKQLTQNQKTEDEVEYFTEVIQKYFDMNSEQLKTFFLLIYKILTRQQRQILQFRIGITPMGEYMEKCTMQEIAEKLGVTKQNVYTLQSLALGRIKDFFTQNVDLFNYSNNEMIKILKQRIREYILANNFATFNNSRVLIRMVSI
jgi:RNA polymerase sigma factor (sigma-70 family)